MSLCNPGCLGSCCEDQAGLMPAFVCFPSAGLKVVPHHCPVREVLNHSMSSGNHWFSVSSYQHPSDDTFYFSLKKLKYFMNEYSARIAEC